jgi:hypothetical protein
LEEDSTIPLVTHCHNVLLRGTVVEVGNVCKSLEFRIYLNFVYLRLKGTEPDSKLAALVRLGELASLRVESGEWKVESRTSESKLRMSRALEATVLETPS